MNATTTATIMNPENFIGYEYKHVVASRRLASIYLDYFSCFGWEVEDSSFSRQLGKVSVTFKRNRKLRNKVEIDRYQRQFEDGVESIAHLEGTKTAKASVVAYTVGIIGAAFMAGATFSYLGGFVVSCILLAIPGFVCWGLAYVLYRSLVKKRSAEVVTEVNREFDNLYSTCEKAQALMV